MYSARRQNPISKAFLLLFISISHSAMADDWQPIGDLTKPWDRKEHEARMVREREIVREEEGARGLTKDNYPAVTMVAKYKESLLNSRKKFQEEILDYLMRNTRYENPAPQSKDSKKVPRVGLGLNPKIEDQYATFEKVAKLFLTGSDYVTDKMKTRLAVHQAAFEFASLPISEGGLGYDKEKALEIANRLLDSADPLQRFVNFYGWYQYAVGKKSRAGSPLPQDTAVHIAMDLSRSAQSMVLLYRHEKELNWLSLSFHTRNDRSTAQNFMDAFRSVEAFGYLSEATKKALGPQLDEHDPKAIAGGQ